ncbi:hypothetical protein HDU67_000318 [Dinochytrium kinnereticum]|nr:hypothetical protein HDU67_000318 [Dinochytrium kinnereticum]
MLESGSQQIDASILLRHLARLNSASSGEDGAVALLRQGSPPRLLVRLSQACARSMTADSKESLDTVMEHSLGILANLMSPDIAFDESPRAEDEVLLKVFRLGCVAATSFGSSMTLISHGMRLCCNVSSIATHLAVNLATLLRNEEVIPAMFIMFLSKNVEDVLAASASAVLDSNIELLESALEGLESPCHDLSDIQDLFNHSADIYMPCMVDVLPTLFQDGMDWSRELMDRLSAFVRWTQHLVDIAHLTKFALSLDFNKVCTIIYTISTRLPISCLENKEEETIDASWEVDDELEDLKRSHTQEFSNVFTAILGQSLLHPTTSTEVIPPENVMASISLGRQALCIGIPSHYGWAVLHFTCQNLVSILPQKTGVELPEVQKEGLTAMLDQISSVQKGLEITAADMKAVGLTMPHISCLVQETLCLLLILIGRLAAENSSWTSHSNIVLKVLAEILQP